MARRDAWAEGYKATQAAYLAELAREAQREGKPASQGAIKVGTVKR